MTRKTDKGKEPMAVLVGKPVFPTFPVWFTSLPVYLTIIVVLLALIFLKLNADGK